MLTKEENELLTRTGPGTLCGDLMRRYWQPVAISDELPPGGAPVPIRMLGEELVLFRDEKGHPGLLALHCAHRGADLSYARLEDGGLRCIYHGWLYDVQGRCLEQPGEPAGSTFHERIHLQSYPCREAGGLVFAYLGPGEPPELPAYEFLDAPEERRLILRFFQDCNYLQANEGNLDQVHLSFLHRVSEEAVRGTTIGDRAPGSSQSATALLAQDVCPQIETQETAFGMRECVIRKAPEGYYFKVENFVLPSFAAVPGGTQGQDGYLVNWHVPIDDTCHWKYMVTFRKSGPLDKARLRSVLLGDNDLLPDGRMTRNKDNRYLQERESMRKNVTFAGLGIGFALHDTWVVESQSTVQDRTVEHLGYEDKSIIALRQAMLRGIEAIREGKDPPHVIREAAANHFPDLVVTATVLRSDQDWMEYLQELVAKNGADGAPLIAAPSQGGNR